MIGSCQLQADDAAHSPSEAAAEAEVAAGGDVDVDDGRQELVADGSGAGGGRGGGGAGGTGGDAGGAPALDGLHTYAGELVRCS
jgi:hypothetical protein